MAVLRRVSRAPRYAAASLRALHGDATAFLPLWRDVRNSVRGWLRMPDAHFLYTMARRGPATGAIVEIGSAWGRSTIFLARGSRDAHREKVIAIDPHTGDDWFLAEAGLPRIDSHDEFMTNLARHGVDSWVLAVRKTSTDAALSLPAEPIRLLFIDGLHTYEGVAADIRDWVPRVAAGGIVVFDDYMNTDAGVGVKQAVDELLETGLVGCEPHTVFNLTWLTRTGLSGL
jgi:predicted O-methyltransferase YrrM